MLTGCHHRESRSKVQESKSTIHKAINLKVQVNRTLTLCATFVTRHVLTLYSELSCGVCHRPRYHNTLEWSLSPSTVPSTLYSKTLFIGFKRKENMRSYISRIFFNRTVSPSFLSLFLSEPFDHLLRLSSFFLLIKLPACAPIFTELLVKWHLGHGAYFSRAHFLFLEALTQGIFFSK
ncbi:hypothetical protein LR48_Vigan07g183800 [Vigna angularis]|uniref:Uncharacterized protein n=1 Tax=Phaseolus angularis TaxID=3914 RepID=A0A0L9V027_PHAAN|nr:hypothetical protein LR48_Vigan07g183800 [Vigna angularis]